MQTEFLDKTDDQLIADAKGLYWSVYVVDCAGATDALVLSSMIQELEDRGYKSVETIDFIDVLENEDEE